MPVDQAVSATDAQHFLCLTWCSSKSVFLVTSPCGFDGRLSEIAHVNVILLQPKTSHGHTQYTVQHVQTHRS